MYGRLDWLHGGRYVRGDESTATAKSSGSANPPLPSNGGWRRRPAAGGGGHWCGAKLQRQHASQATTKKNQSETNGDCRAHYTRKKNKDGSSFRTKLSTIYSGFNDADKLAINAAASVQPCRWWKVAAGKLQRAAALRAGQRLGGAASRTGQLCPVSTLYQSPPCQQGF